MKEVNDFFEKELDQMNKEFEKQSAILQKHLDEELDRRSQQYSDWMAIRQQLGIVGLEEQYRVEKLKLDELRDAGIMDEELYQQALLAIKLKYAEDYANKAVQFMQGLQNVVSGLENLALQESNIRKEKELAAARDNADKKKKEELAAAGNNAKEKAAIEKKYRQEEIDIQKKYADANFALQVSQIIASTALAAMNAYSSMAGIPIAGPALGAIAAAAAIAAGAIQIASAKAARDQAKSISLSGGSSSNSGGSRITSAGGYQSGGYTGDGAPSQPAGVVHRGEYVVPNLVMRNPAAIDHLRVLEAMRKNYYPFPHRSTGFQQGGFTDPDPATLSQSSHPSLPSPLSQESTSSISLDSLNDTLLKLNHSIDTLNRKGARVSYERLQQAQNAATDVIYRATRQNH